MLKKKIEIFESGTDFAGINFDVLNRYFSWYILEKKNNGKIGKCNSNLASTILKQLAKMAR